MKRLKIQKVTFEELLSYCIINRDRIFINEIPLAASYFDDVLSFIFEWLEKQEFPPRVTSQINATRDKKTKRAD